MRRTPLLLACVVAAVAGCSALKLGGEPDPEQRLHAALAALKAKDMARAQEDLQWVYTHHWAEPVGQQALLVLIAAELDPRNPSRRLWASADMSARMLNNPDARPWMEPVAETLYLIALELGANEERISRAEAALDSAMALPELNGQTVPQQIDALTEQRDSLMVRAEQLAQQLEQKEKELKAKDQELERIRKTIKG